MRAILGATGLGVRAAVIDSGVRITAETGPILGGMSFVDERWHDETGHGTAVAATLRSLAPDAELLAVKVFDRHLETTAALLADGIRWASRQGASVINVSAGVVGHAGRATIDEAVRQATSNGAIVIVPAPDILAAWRPRFVPGLVFAAADAGCPPERLRRLDSVPVGFAACPDGVAFAGMAPALRPRGVSFAVARVSAWVCRARQAMPVDECEDASRMLSVLLDAVAAPPSDREAEWTD